MILLFELRSSRAKLSDLPLLWIRCGYAKLRRQRCCETSVRQPKMGLSPVPNFEVISLSLASRHRASPAEGAQPRQHPSWCTGGAQSTEQVLFSVDASLCALF